jgi:prepilin-type N-terminal cleavage/methylation domain-containing protein
MMARMKASVEASHGRGSALASGRGPRFRAFSLIELLVVMAIMAIMAAMMLPTLSKANHQASAAKCLNNQKQMANAFHMYTADNFERIVQMADYDTGEVIYPAGGFWGGPVPPPSAWTGPDEALSAVQTGLETNNALYFYCNAVEDYHCPGDTRMQNTPALNNPSGWAYDSYSRTQNLGGEPRYNYWGAGATYTKMSAIPMPGSTFSMLEDADWRGYNVGTWVVNWAGDSFDWQDPPAMSHIDVNSIAFADGHAELHKWSDPGIILAGQGAARGTPELNWPGPTNGADYQYVYKGYQFPGHP